MTKSKKIIRISLYFIATIAIVVIASYFSAHLWGGKEEELPEDIELVMSDNMTMGQFGKQNAIPNPVLKQTFNLQSKSDLQKKLTDFALTDRQIESAIRKNMALSAEYESKNWIKIPIKFALWFAFLIMVFIFMHRRMLKVKLRKRLYFSAILIFGIILGSDPSPMGTVKDAVYLLGSKGVIFPPRMIALGVFIIMVLLANKFICSWGCQFGVLQDFIFRINRRKKDRGGLFRQYKPPFVVTNSIRVGFFAIFSVAAFLWAVDIISPIDPFKIYKPGVIMIGGGIFIGIILIASLFIYRPWCYLFCPFGLVGWLVEKISIFKIKVNYDTCIACESCARACPSTVMQAILKRESTISDCFACGNCVDVCPTDSVSFSSGIRQKPPEGKFEGKIKIDRKK